MLRLSLHKFLSLQTRTAQWAYSICLYGRRGLMSLHIRSLLINSSHLSTDDNSRIAYGIPCLGKGRNWKFMRSMQLRDPLQQKSKLNSRLVQRWWVARRKSCRESGLGSRPSHTHSCHSYHMPLLLALKLNYWGLSESIEWCSSRRLFRGRRLL